MSASRTKACDGELVVFLPADPPRAGRLMLTGDLLSGLGSPGTAGLVLPPGDAVVAVPVRDAPVAEVLPVLVGTPAAAHAPALAF
jgi:hypothetical protein